jgi:hypothetical protein
VRDWPLSNVQVWRSRVHKGAGRAGRQPVYPDLALLALPPFATHSYTGRNSSTAPIDATSLPALALWLWLWHYARPASALENASWEARRAEKTSTARPFASLFEVYAHWTLVDLLALTTPLRLAWLHIQLSWRASRPHNYDMALN